MAGPSARFPMSEPALLLYRWPALNGDVSSMYLQPRGNMRLRVQKWGNSLALRIPAAFARETGLGPGADVSLELDGNRLIITPNSHGPYTLSGLLDGVTEENLHDAVDTGVAQGREVW